MIQFMRYKNIFLIISAITMVVMITALSLWGLTPGIDFTGGSIIELKKDGLDVAQEREAMTALLQEKGVEVRTLSATGDGTIEIKAKEMTQEQLQLVEGPLKEKYEGIEVVNFETVGPSVGQEQVQDTVVAVLITIAALLLYIGWRFQNRRFGVTAVIALVHDVFVILGVFAFIGKFYSVEVDLMFVTATLTTMTFSVHDTIVVYDRIRETVRHNPQIPFEQVVDQALNQTIVRSLSTSLSIIFVLLALLLLGGDTIRWFVLALLVGTISGTYSSTFTATPLLAVWYQWRNKP